MRSGWRECILSWGECEEKENQSWTISTVASKVAAFPQNRQKMFTDATNLATMVPTKGPPRQLCHGPWPTDPEPWQSQLGVGTSLTLDVLSSTAGNGNPDHVDCGKALLLF